MSGVASRHCVMEVITRLVHGGAQETTVLIVLRLLKEGYDVVLAHGPGDPSLLNRLPKDHPHLTILPVPEFRRRILPVHDVLALFRLWRFMKKHQVHVVHTHTSKAGILGRWAAYLAGVKVIIHSPRGSIYHETYYSEPVLRFFAWLERLTARFTDKIVTLNESEKKDYIRYQIAPPDKFTTIYSGIEISRYAKLAEASECLRQELQLPVDRPLVGYVARMTPEKGHDLCLKAFQKVLTRVPKAMLVLVGGGPLEADIRQQVQGLGLGDSVKMLGFRADVERILPFFQCCVQTSYWDGLPRAMVEAMVAAKPVVATAVGGIPEILIDGRSGYVVPENNADAIADSVVDLLHHPEQAAKMGQNARADMIEKFDVDASVEKLFALYGALISSKHTQV